MSDDDELGEGEVVATVVVGGCPPEVARVEVEVLFNTEA